MHTFLGDKLLGGRYRLSEPLGKGGMADVYDAVDERLGRRVAVKVLAPAMAARDDVRRRFEAEARSAARLAHPNVVTVFDTGEDDGQPWLVMERLPGVTLADHLDRPLDPAWVRRLAGDILGALGAAHAAGIVHRDIKPGNILLASDGCAKVADFGIAKSLEGADDHTTTGQVIGTPAYLAPERIDGEPATVRADIYALGVVLYEALSGRKPFNGDTPVSVAYAVRNGSYPPLEEVRPGLPRDLVATVERAMQWSPSARFASVQEMSRALQPAAAETDATLVLGAIKPISRPHRARRVPRWFAMAASAVVLFVLVAGLLLVIGQSNANALQNDMRAAAAAANPSTDGIRATDAAARLRALATSLDRHDARGTVAAGADAFLGDLANWQARGELAVPAVNRVRALVLRVPGANAAAFVATTTTLAPTTTIAADAFYGNAKRGDGKGKGKGDNGD